MVSLMRKILYMQQIEVINFISWRADLVSLGRSLPAETAADEPHCGKRKRPVCLARKRRANPRGCV